MKTQVCFIVTGYINYLSKHCCAPLSVESIMQQNVTRRYFSITKIVTRKSS